MIFSKWSATYNHTLNKHHRLPVAFTRSHSVSSCSVIVRSLDGVLDSSLVMTLPSSEWLSPPASSRLTVSLGRDALPGARSVKNLVGALGPPTPTA